MKDPSVENAACLPPPSCRYCGGHPVLRHASGNGLKQDASVWFCANYPRCDAKVGCHPGTVKPLGTLADATTRRWRQKAHAVLDPLWNHHVYAKARKKRERVYRQLADHLGFAEFHIALCGVKACKAVIRWAKDRSA